jgi:hypothetical protein
MSIPPAQAVVLGFAFENPTADFPVRSGPGTNFERRPFTVAKNLDQLTPLDVQPDAQNTPNDLDPSRVYQWFMFAFPNGQTGWLRGHIVGIYGDWRVWGYGIIDTPTHAYTLVRGGSTADTPSPETPAAPQPVTMPVPMMAMMTAPSMNLNMSGVPMQQMMHMAGVMSGDPVAIIKTARPASTRRGPSTDFDRAFSLDPDTIVPLLAVEMESGERMYTWYEVAYEGDTAWIREDLCAYQGDTHALGLPDDLYSTPFEGNYTISRGHNLAPFRDPDLSEHDGWDHAAMEGEPIFAGPNGGTVVSSFACAKCTPERPSVVQHGLTLGDPSIFSDPGWGFGFGNYIIVRYRNEQLPKSTCEVLSARGFADGHIFALYGHLKDRLVETGAELRGAVQIGTCGNSGNSSAPHLHLQIRASRSPNFTNFAALRDGAMDPVILFRR